MTILEKIYKNNTKEAFKDIIKKYKEQGFGVVNYLYFANLVSNGIISGKKVNREFLEALGTGDFLLPDGIALQLYYKKYFGLSLSNLNGTDFTEYILKNLKSDEYNLILYGAKKEVIEKAVLNIEQKYGIKIAYFQDGYSEFDFEKLESILGDFYIPSMSSKTQPIGSSSNRDSNSFPPCQENNKSPEVSTEKNKKNASEKINILMVGLGTPKQEIWIKNNLENIKKYNLLAFSQGGTFDFWAGNEKRAPQIFINLKLEWLWRFITNPRKNFKKVWYSLYLFYYLYGKRR
ncbi:MAG: WecB/TagA/CpsF family glycosyltransferase [Candidatus Altimarinota bacterium]